jgi:transcription-repair coupling factor (superfamily II helicase)
VVHLQHGIGRYLGLKNAAGNSRRSSTGNPQRPPPTGTECLVIEYAPAIPANEPPKLYVPVSEAHLVSKYVGAGKARPPLNTLGGTRWAKAKEQTEKAVRDVAAEMLRASRPCAKRSRPCVQAGHAWQREFEAPSFTRKRPTRSRAIAETKADMERPSRWTA